MRACVCVCVCVLNRRYGEMIARKVRDMGMRVEMVLLTPDVTLAGMLEDAVRRHLLYSVLVTEQHELHVSCTVHILEGRMQQGNFCFFIFIFYIQHLTMILCIHGRYLMSFVHMWPHGSGGAQHCIVRCLYRVSIHNVIAVMQ